jgi:hypothetical protein
MTSETFVILPSSANTCTKLSMLDYHPDFAREHKIHHPHLAQHQQTHMVILPVHTAEEKALYQIFLNDNMGYFLGKKQLNWITLA